MTLEEVWLTIVKPTMLVTIAGSPGSGKSALALFLAELLRKNYGLDIWIYGIPKENRERYRGHIHHMDPIADPSQAPNDVALVLEELSLFAHPRRSSSEPNLLLDQLKNLRRHKNLTIICVCQRASEMDRNLALSTDVLLIKQPEPFQSLTGSDRRQFQPHFEKAQELFANPKIKKPQSYTYVSTLGRLVRNPLPSGWSEGISRSLGIGSGDVEGRLPLRKMKREEKIKEALILRKQGKSSREAGRILGVHHTTILNYWKNYPKHSQPRLPEEEFEALKRGAEEEFIGRSGKQIPPEESPEEMDIESPEEWEYPEAEQEELEAPEPTENEVPSEVAETCTMRERLHAMEKNLRQELYANDKSGVGPKELGSLAGGLIAGFPAMFAIDAIDKAIDDTNWDEREKLRAKWLERFIDLGLGICGTAANVIPILRGGGDCYSWFLSAASVDQILISIFKMYELGGVVGGQPVSPSEGSLLFRYDLEEMEEAPTEEVEKAPPEVLADIPHIKSKAEMKQMRKAAEDVYKSALAILEHPLMEDAEKTKYVKLACGAIEKAQLYCD